VCTQQGSYIRQMQLAMEKLNQLPIENFRKYHQVQEDKVCRWLPVTRFNTHMASISSHPFSYINPSLASERLAYRKNRDPKRPVHHNFPKIKQEVSAFGPKHAEHARRFYQSKRTPPNEEFRQLMIPPYRPKYGPMQVSGHREIFGRSLNQTALYTDSLKSQGPVPDTSQPCETILKIAKISPRPSIEQRAKTIGFGVKLLTHRVEQGSVKKSDDFQDSASEKDLSNAPVLQMLCEISNTL